MSDLGAEPRLVVPEGLVIDDGVRERLERGLASAPGSVAGIGAETGALPPGTSYRVHAEWRSLDARLPEPGAEAAREERAIAGAALLRPDVGFAVRDGVVELSSGSLLVDPGAPVHDPYSPIAALEVASETGRPPFPLRPVVVLLGCEAEGLADWARRFANRLVRRDVEARIAVPDVAEGMHLTRPCLPSEASIRALAPDVVVALDGAALAQVDAWCAGDRSTVVVELVPSAASDIELVSWQIGRASGRLRARIGPRVDAAAFAVLVGRLCAGPHPVPPSDRPELLDVRTPVREQWTSGSGSKPGCVVVTGASPGRDLAARVSGLVDNLEAASVTASSVPASGGVPADARAAAVVVLSGVTSSRAVLDLIAERAAAGLPTALDLGSNAIDPSGPSGSPPRLTESAAALANACGLVLSPPGAVHLAARSLGIRALALPSLLTRGRATELRDARAVYDPAPPLVIGWHIGSGDERRPAYTGVVAEVVSKILTDRSDVRVQLVGDAARAPISRRGDAISVVSADALDASAVARWTAHLFTPELMGGDAASDALAFETAGCAGVPSVMPASARGVIDGYVSPHLMVKPADQPGDWARALQHLLGNAERRASRSEEAARRADAVDALATARTVVSRFMGWAQYRSPDRVSV